MILIPNECGLCNGAKSCIDKACKIKEQNFNRKVVIYKEILHNPKVVDELKSRGIDIIDNLDNITEEIVIIRGHGESRSTFEFLEQHNINYYDATCPNVKKLQMIVDEYYNNGYKIVIVGKKDHPEVIGVNGWANNEAIIIETLSDLDNVQIEGNILVVSQTTFNYIKLMEIVNVLKVKYPKLSFVNTVCNAQKEIQMSSKKTALLCDLMIVLGGKNSSNTHELWSICNEICPSYKFENIEEVKNWIHNIDLTSITNLGVTGGASTPKSDILEVKDMIKKMIK